METNGGPIDWQTDSSKTICSPFFEGGGGGIKRLQETNYIDQI